MLSLLKPNQIHLIPSFVRREGRITPAQKKALEQLWPIYGLSLGAGYLDLTAIFSRQIPLILEIGFGNGESIAQQAYTTPEVNFLGIEVYRPGVGQLLAQLKAKELKNVRLINEDALKVLQYHLPDQSLDGAQIFFPDPWPKKRHHKRRLIQLPFIDLLWHKIKPNGWIHLATDWQDYAIQMMEALSQYKGFYNIAGQGQFIQNLGQRPITKFEHRGQRLGNLVWDLKFKRID
ncbi:tRNA (guanine-N(7)-)-methyltransferase [Candidatus Nitrosoglobus terrae]|uniref:tRNA (guanine-N(7)-)-methyltransferase n=1 Tax=Candidatus Nitrosoglobus terrae TaxID=1630141 RepID=A0A1Q2SNP6_9GAMM|nr:tRNA (guanosine(46)-N7)-methyltransferase TrmB [Candidatus Nitrosoglobus terrae]BAW80741.1 tRNA (guanine-N(7)-)-methyltransferase [Candidatus Nitrosoglobus terrae]